MDNAKFEDLVGKTLVKIDKAKKGDDAITFTTDNGEVYSMSHNQDCCESVNIEDICGDLEDLLYSPIMRASEDTNGNDPPPAEVSAESYTWTFYNIATMKGHVTIRWFGRSNGYYSESVNFVRVY
jgi:hypothetical protein